MISCPSQVITHQFEVFKYGESIIRALILFIKYNLPSEPIERALKLLNCLSSENQDCRTVSEKSMAMKVNRISSCYEKDFPFSSSAFESVSFMFDM